MKFQQWFRIGMKRTVPEFLSPGPVQLTVGGSEVTDDLLYRPHWDALAQRLLEKPDARGWRSSIRTESIDTIWCNHFLEHLPGNRAVEMLREFERVLKIGGVANIVTPYYNSHMQAHDPDHKSAWNEDSWKTIFDCAYYSDHGDWKLKVHACLIVGIVERNLALFTQLTRLP